MCLFTLLLSPSNHKAKHALIVATPALILLALRMRMMARKLILYIQANDVTQIA